MGSFSILSAVAGLLLPILSFIIAMYARRLKRISSLVKGQLEGTSTVDEAFRHLRSGFALSLILVVLLVVVPVLLILWPSWIFAMLVYILSITRRAKGWKLLGMNRTGSVMQYCCVFIVSYPSWIWLFVLYSGLAFEQSITIAFSVPIVPWTVYTYLENNSLRELDRRFGTNLRLPRILALLGTVSASVTSFYDVIAISLRLFPYYLMYFYPGWAIFACPFLVASCFLAHRNLRQTPDDLSASHMTDRPNTTTQRAPHLWELFRKT